LEDETGTYCKLFHEENFGIPETYSAVAVKKRDKVQLFYAYGFNNTEKIMVVVYEGESPKNLKPTFVQFLYSSVAWYKFHGDPSKTELDLTDNKFDELTFYEAYYANQDFIVPVIGDALAVFSETIDTLEDRLNTE